MNRLIVEADGGSRGNPGIAAGGAVVIDPTDGQVLAEIGVFVGHASNIRSAASAANNTNR